MAVLDGRLVAERYRDGYDRRTPLLGWSMTKSVVATLFARELMLGQVGSVDERAAVPEWSGAGDARGAITYDQLLRMTSGLEFFGNYELPWSDSLRMLFTSPDAAAFAAAKELAHPPGTVWSYSDGTSNVLARCVRTLCAASDEERRLFPQRELFAPLSMSTAVIGVDAAGDWVGSYLMQASARDWARFGWLYANDGVFAGRRLLPEGWVDAASSATPASPNRCYGAHFWRYDESSGRKESGEPFPPSLAGVFYAAGHDGQYVWIDRVHARPRAPRSRGARALRRRGLRERGARGAALSGATVRERSSAPAPRARTGRSRGASLRACGTRARRAPARRARCRRTARDWWRRSGGGGRRGTEGRAERRAGSSW